MARGLVVMILSLSAVFVLLPKAFSQQGNLNISQLEQIRQEMDRIQQQLKPMRSQMQRLGEQLKAVRAKMTPLETKLKADQDIILKSVNARGHVQ
jgi:septal ring factor EnvC (AmiA/AmiB activator)